MVVGGNGLEAECSRGLDVFHQLIYSKPLTTEIHERQVDTKPHLISPPCRLVSANTAHLPRSAHSCRAHARVYVFTAHSRKPQSGGLPQLDPTALRFLGLAGIVSTIVEIRRWPRRRRRRGLPVLPT